MSFRATMDNIWFFMYYLNFIMIGFISIGNVVIPLDVIYYIILFSYLVISLSFIFFYNKTIDRGHVGAVRIFKPSIRNSVAIKEEMEAKRLLSVFGILCLGMFFVGIYSDEYRGIAFTLMLILGIIFFIISQKFHSSSSVKSKNNFIRLILTESKIKLYSPGCKLREFSRSLLSYNFINEYEMILSSAEHDSKIIVNTWQLPENEKQELQMLLGEETENLNRD